MGFPEQLNLIDKGSIGALRHEYRHFLDDEENNFQGMKGLFKNKDAFFQREENGYNEELKIAREKGFLDTEKKILKEIDKRRREIYGLD